MDNICFWESINYSEDKYTWGAGPDGEQMNHEIGTGWNGWNGDNEFSSVKNATEKWAVLYANDGFGGGYICLAPWANSYHLGAQYGFNDQAESFRLYPNKPSFC